MHPPDSPTRPIPRPQPVTGTAVAPPVVGKALPEPELEPLKAKATDDVIVDTTVAVAPPNPIAQLLRCFCLPFGGDAGRIEAAPVCVTPPPAQPAAAA